MKLITELVENVEYLEEESSGSKNLFIQGPFLQFDVVNKNSRHYSSEICAPEVQRYIKEMVEQDRAYGELGHPDGPRINLDRASHLIKSLTRQGSTWIGKARIMEETPMGSIAAGIIHAGGRLGASSRALGTVKTVAGINEVQNDFRLATAADIVADPSAPSAFVNGIYEQKQWVYNNGILTEQQVDELKDQTDAAFVSTKDRGIKLMMVFESFLEKLQNAKFNK
jgi:hypothetical protein